MADSTTYRLAKHDVARWSDIITASKGENETAFYTNSSHLPDCSIMLVTTEQCPNCHTVKALMNDANFSYDVVEASTNPEVVSQYKVRSAPTLIVKSGDDINTYSNESNICSFVLAHLMRQ